jgi:lipoprotein-anchoring transpeptidase ErfK/SrfK
MARGRHVPRRRARAAIVIGAIACFLLLALGGAAYAAYRYEQSRADLILPGVAIDGVDVSGMTRGQALRAIRGSASQVLDRQLTIRVGDEVWETSPALLGRRAAVTAAVDEAMAAAQPLGTFDRFWHRFRDEPMGVEIDLTYATQGPAIDQLVSEIADSVFVPWRNASIGVNEDVSDITFVRSRPGAKLDQTAAASAIRSAIESGRPVVRLEPETLQPKYTSRNLGPTIVVRVDRNRLELYDGFRLEQTWDVATAKPGWTTPTGVWTIWDKRENPTWYNPALDDWGAGLPAVVPGGPGNPMGTRAIYIDAPGLIRIHGTPDPSSVGRYASHGCIRMRNEEVEDLFEQIPVGAHVIVVGRRPAGAGYWDTPDRFDI